MFHFIQKKKYLKDLIPTNHVDIHSHLLPGIDDGAPTFEDTFFLATELQKLGFEQCITTPHVMTAVWDNTREIIENTYDATVKNLKPKLDFPLRVAAEYLLDANFNKLFQIEPLLVLKENYVLVEMSYINPPIQLYDILFELQVAGYQPVLAHPERYTFFHRNFSEYEKLKNAGCQFQLNLLSTVGYYGTDAMAVSEKLLKKGLIDFVGSDVHHENHLNALSRRLLFKDTAALSEAFDKNQFFRF